MIFVEPSKHFSHVVFSRAITCPKISISISNSALQATSPEGAMEVISNALSDSIRRAGYGLKMDGQFSSYFPVDFWGTFFGYDPGPRDILFQRFGNMGWKPTHETKKEILHRSFTWNIQTSRRKTS